MTPEIKAGIDQLVAAAIAGLTTLITAAVGYGVWKIKQLRDIKADQDEDRKSLDARKFLDNLIGTTVAYINQVYMPKRMPGGLDPQTRSKLKATAVEQIYKRLPGPIHARLLEFYGSLADLNAYISFKLESEVGLQKPTGVKDAAPSAG
jgi:hypothetical protein